EKAMVSRPLCAFDSSIAARRVQRLPPRMSSQMPSPGLLSPEGAISAAPLTTNVAAPTGTVNAQPMMIIPHGLICLLPEIALSGYVGKQRESVPLAADRTGDLSAAERGCHLPLR